jgi:hypothetical protein
VVVEPWPAAEVIALPVAAAGSSLQETVPPTAPAESSLSPLSFFHHLDNPQLSPPALSVEPEVVCDDTQMVPRASMSAYDDSPIADRLVYTSLDAVEIAVSNEATEILSRSLLKTDYGVKAAAKPKPEPPAWYQTQAMSVLT